MSQYKRLCLANQDSAAPVNPGGSRGPEHPVNPIGPSEPEEPQGPEMSLAHISSASVQRP